MRLSLGRVIRDIVRKIEGEAELESAFAHPLMLARRVREQRQHQRGRKSLADVVRVSFRSARGVWPP